MYITKKDIPIPFSSSWACIGLHWVLWACIDLRWPLLACVGCCLLDGLGPGHGCSHRDPHPNPRTPGPVTRSGLADPCHSLLIPTIFRPHSYLIPTIFRPHSYLIPTIFQPYSNHIPTSFLPHSYHILTSFLPYMVLYIILITFLS